MRMLISGGLGNQMFQYAAYSKLKNDGYDISIDLSMYDLMKMHNGYELSRVFGIKETETRRGWIYQCLIRLLLHFKPKCLIQFNMGIKDYPPLPKIPFLKGEFQNELFFNDNTINIAKLFVFKGIDKRNKDSAREIKSRESVSIHIRRGDYLSCGMDLLSESYYKRAIEVIYKKINSPFFYIFSDDEKEAARLGESMKIEYKVISHNIGTDSYKDMYLMSQCKHNIIANSSFSWWGAWLNENPDKIVICPYWLDGFACNSWIELRNCYK